MIRTLVSVNKDLASSIALRYACRMSKTVDIVFQTLNVQEPGPEYNLPGTGWVRKSWESALWESGKDDIDRLLSSENAHCSVLGDAKIKVGDRCDEILLELYQGVYDIYMEGALSTFKVGDFHKMLKSKLFRNISCPVIVVKNLVELHSMTLVITPEQNYRKLVSDFSKIFKDSALSLELIFWKMDKKTKLNFTDQGECQEDVDSLKKIFKEYDCPIINARVARGRAKDLAHHLRKFGLVASGIEKTVGKKSPLLELLAKTESPVMLFWQ